MKNHVVKLKHQPPRWCFRKLQFLDLKKGRLYTEVRPYLWALPIVFWFFLLHYFDQRKQSRLAKRAGK